MAVKQDAELKFAMMSGAFENAGDHLIVKRSEELIKYFYPNAKLFFYFRNESIEAYLDEINGMDAMIFCGGPAYKQDIYPDKFPLVSDLNRIKVPMFALGMGGFGADIMYTSVYKQQFTDLTKEFLRRIENDTKVLGCRDWYSVNILRNNGIWSGKMTGCPAWYDLKYMRQDFIQTDPYKVKKVCISAPADINSLKQLVDVVTYVRQVFSKAEIKVLFHRSYFIQDYSEQEALQIVGQTNADCEEMGAECVNISKGLDGFSIYDNCDMHIGFRVHAHIYNLSRRNVSILIEEDARGAGVNSALGLENIRSYDYGAAFKVQEEHVISGISHKENEYLLQLVDDYVNNLYQADFLQIKNAYRMMQEYFKQMEQHITSLCKYI